MLIGFFIGIILLFTAVIFAINPITRAVNNAIIKYNEFVEKKRLKKEEVERKEYKLEEIRKETETLRAKLKLETEINDESCKHPSPIVYEPTLTFGRKEEDYYRYDDFEWKFDQDYYDWGLDEPVGMSKPRKNRDW